MARRKTVASNSRDEFVIVGPNKRTRVAKHQQQPLALIETQNAAVAAQEDGVWKIKRRALIGTSIPVTLYTVERRDGKVYTTIDAPKEHQ